MGLEFQKKKEDFICEYCKVEVIGDGYTNHCPKCLWSKHVDIHPGDRAAKCLGMMEPTAVFKKGEEYVLTHTCEVCGYTKDNKTIADDDFEVLMKI